MAMAVCMTFQAGKNVSWRRKSKIFEEEFEVPNRKICRCVTQAHYLETFLLIRFFIKGMAVTKKYSKNGTFG